ncbi:hypothetical protein CYMTET_17839 [Cymbomonas tetramitiformis]|uniref:Uncharacterized protein n=1 Tax=Cymbomonas tetramitiformis TaxID=36881 RepID=A0AAE0GAM6_9CHLO|nr:hypothetical protein CYMTET_17839 [Cymbomonas tetramitiformis]
MEVEATKGHAIQGMPRKQMPPLTPWTYISKSFTSTMKNARKNQVVDDGESSGVFASASVGQSFAIYCTYIQASSKACVELHEWIRK